MTKSFRMADVMANPRSLALVAALICKPQVKVFVGKRLTITDGSHTVHLRGFAHWMRNHRRRVNA